MKHAFIFFVGFLLTTTIIAQNITVTGRLVSETDNEPLPYATIAVAHKSAPEQKFRKFATKENGSFSTELEKGQYIFVFNFVGMDQVERTIDLSSTINTYDMGDIIMSESSTQLDELSVTAQKPLVKIGRAHV